MTDKTEQSFIFDLDAVEKERSSDDAPKFTANIGGRTITFVDPKSVDWLVLAELEDDPAEFVEVCIQDEDDVQHVLSQKISSGGMEKLMEAFMRYYKIGGRRGNRGASRR